MPEADGQMIRLADYRPPDYLIDEVELDVNLAAEATRVVAELSIRPNPAGRNGVPLDLDGDELELISVALDNEALSAADYEADPSKLVLKRPPARPFRLRIETRLNPRANTKLMGLYRSGSAYCTQCEAEGFRRIVYFLDRPDVMSVYRVRLEAGVREAPILLANGNLESAGPATTPGRHVAIWRDPFKKPCYLFALVAGDLGAIRDRFVTMSGREVALAIYVEHGREARAAYAMDALKRAMAWDERTYGREYDLEQFNIVAVSDFNMGAMENKGLNIFNEKYVLAAPETATDDDYAQIEGVIAHEYFHNWTGNRITCRDWFQLCLKEGLTVFRDQDFSADERSAPVKRIADVRTLRAAQFPEDAGPLAHNVRPEAYREINNFYTATVYQKGAEVIRMLRLLIGAEAFRRGMDLYFERCDGTAATVEDFLACFADASRRDLTQFKLWYMQAGTPRLRISTVYLEDVRALRVEFAQTLDPTPGQPTKAPMTIPIGLALIDREAGPLPLSADEASSEELRRGVIVLDREQRALTFKGLARRPTLSALRGFSAPARVEDDLTEDDLAALSRKDDDPVNRWQALQTLATRAALRAADAARLGAPPDASQHLVAAAGELLKDAASGAIDPAFAALALTLPSEADLAREKGSDVDPEAIFLAREGLRASLGRAHEAALGALFERFASKGPFSPDAASAGRRALRNAALSLLIAASPEEGALRAGRQFDGATNMTERLGALGCLALSRSKLAEAALSDFEKAFGAEPLVMDKWFALQAMIPEAGAVARVRALMSHPAFSFSNPNRVRSLIGGFTANQTQFNRKDGEGFALLKDVVLRVDSSNPQISARLLTALRSWRSLEATRRTAAEATLKAIAATPDLSRDTRDIVTRSLE